MASHDAYCPLTADGEPSIFERALNRLDASLWMMAMQEKMKPYIETRYGNLFHLHKDGKSLVTNGSIRSNEMVMIK